ncbi:MAG: hypothetical protein GEEBNDBF_02520 [bacterium]|nr:hypothetical protein [bacterium]
MYSPVNVPAVFISYSRTAASALAAALAAALAPGEAFVDQSAMLPGEPISEAILQAALEARVLVCFLSPDFFTRPYCQAEFEIALARWDALRTLPPKARGLVLCLPAGRHDQLLDHLPQELRDINWPTFPELSSQVALIRQLLDHGHSQPLSALLPPLAREQLEARATALTAIPARADQLDPARTLGVPHLAPSRFVGRELLLRSLLHQLVSPSGHHAVALTGPGGTGKTRLVAEFVWRYGPTHFPGGMYWLQVSTPDLWIPQVHALLQHLDPAIPALRLLLEADTDLGLLLRQTFQRAGELPRLLVLDGVTSDQAGQLPLTLVTGDLGNTALLLTSQVALPPPVTNLPVPPLPRWASRELLTSDLTEAALPLPLADQLAARLGDWPLAMDLLQVALATGAIDHAQIHQLLEGGSVTPILAETADLLQQMLPSVPLPAIGDSLQLSLDALDPAALKLAEHLAWLPDAPIPMPFLAILEEQGIARSARATLRLRGWIMPGSDAAYGRMHPILADFLRSRPASEAALLPLAEALRQLQITHDCSLVNEASLHLALAPHVLRVGRYPSLPLALRLEVLGEVAFFQEALGQKEPTLALRQEVWELAQAEAPDGSLLPLEYEYEYAVSSFEFREPRCTLDWLASLSERAHMLAGPEAELTLNIEFLRAKFLVDRLGEVGQARALFELVRDRRASLPGLATARSVTPLRELGLIALKENDLSLAIRYLEEAMAIAEKVLGPEHSTTNDCGHHLAMALMFAGRYDEALPVSSQALACRQRQLGPQSQSTLATAHNHAELLYLRGDREASATLFMEVARSRAAIFGPQDSRSLNSLAHAWRLRGLLGEARAIRELSALAIRLTTALHPAHTWVRKVRGFTAQVACWQHLLPPAGFEAALVLEEELEATPPLVGQLAQMLATVGWLALQTGDGAGFLKQLMRAGPVLQQHLNPQHPFCLLLDVQRQLLTGAPVTSLAMLAAHLGTGHWEVQALYAADTALV